jgi:NTE family protein
VVSCVKMLRCFALWLTCAALAPLPAAPLVAQECRVPRTALVLSGGGAKGVAHIGVLRVLDSLGIRPDLIVGTSMGAAVGALYASGYSGRELDSLVRVVPLAALFRAYQPLAPRSLGVLQPLVVWEQGERGFALQSAGVVEAEANALLNAAMLRGNLLARGNFDSLRVPFRAVATDLAHREVVVLRSGDLAQAVRASAAVPLLFAPEPIDGRILTDGGLSANVPVAVARAEGAERVIVVDATEHSDSLRDYAPLPVANRLLEFLFQQRPDSLYDGDLYVRPDVQGFAALNFGRSNIDQLLMLGSTAADTTLPRLGCRSTAPLAVRQSPTRLTAISIPEANASERLALTRLLGLGDSLDVDLLRGRLRNLATASEAYQSVWLTPSGGGDSVEFRLALRRASRRVAGLGLAYDNELGGRMWAGIVDRGFLGRAAEGSAAVFLGELRREVYVGLRRNYQVGRQLVNPTATVRLALEDIRQFDSDGDELSSVRTREAVGFLGVERPLARGWELAGGATGRIWDEAGQEDQSTVGLVARVTAATPGRGRLLLAEVEWTGIYQRLALEASGWTRFGSVRAIPRVRLGWGEELPLQLQFPLGGYDGLGGYHLGERRGDREVLLGVLFTVPLKGPLVARFDVGGGRTATGGALLGSEGWAAGIRAGIGAETPVGPVRFEYGLGLHGREALFVRLGRWF